MYDLALRSLRSLMYSYSCKLFREVVLTGSEFELLESPLKALVVRSQLLLENRVP